MDMSYDPKDPFTRTDLLNTSWFGTVDLDDHMVRGLILAFLYCSVLLLALILAAAAATVVDQRGGLSVDRVMPPYVQENLYFGSFMSWRAPCLIRHIQQIDV